MRVKLMLLVLLLAPVLASAKTISVAVDGMVCDFCAQGIKKNFGAVPAIKSVTVNLEKHFVKLETKDGQDISDESITKNIEAAGDTVTKITRE